MDGGFWIERYVARQRGHGSLQSFAALLRLWRSRTRERRHLARLDERMLRDIGITRLDAARECAKPFWRH
jgi:uncharacterized protein YjiS (DUF1127 family)